MANFGFFLDFLLKIAYYYFISAVILKQMTSADLSGLKEVDVSSPTCLNTKMVHIVGLTEDDTEASVYDALCKPGRNRAIEHLMNPHAFRILNMHPCKKDRNVYRATAVISTDIWNIILNKMNKKLKVDYLSCSVYLRPDSIRCFKCQRLGHTQQNCTGDTTCVNCGQAHTSNGCQNEPNCINCSGTDHDCSHRADSSDCPTYRNHGKGSLLDAKK